MVDDLQMFSLSVFFIFQIYFTYETSGIFMVKMFLQMIEMKIQKSPLFILILKHKIQCSFNISTYIIYEHYEGNLPAEHEVQ